MRTAHAATPTNGLARKNVISPSRCGHYSVPLTGGIVESFVISPDGGRKSSSG
jgi:hypothetical protein